MKKQIAAIALSFSMAGCATNVKVDVDISVTGATHKPDDDYTPERKKALLDAREYFKRLVTNADDAAAVDTAYLKAIMTDFKLKLSSLDPSGKKSHDEVEAELINALMTNMPKNIENNIGVIRKLQAEPKTLINSLMQQLACQRMSEQLDAAEQLGMDKEDVLGLPDGKHLGERKTLLLTSCTQNMLDDRRMNAGLRLPAPNLG